MGKELRSSHFSRQWDYRYLELLVVIEIFGAIPKDLARSTGVFGCTEHHHRGAESRA